MTSSYFEPPAGLAQNRGVANSIRIAEVTTVNSDGTVAIRPLRGRGGKQSVRYPTWYVPTIGDRVLIADLDGGPLEPIIVAPLSPRDGSLVALGHRWAPTPPELVTTLPAGADRLEVHFLADAANGIVWHLRFRAASSSPYKWEFVGGPPLVAYVQAAESRAVGATGDLTTPGPSVTLPLAGDYDATQEWAAFETALVGNASLAQTELWDAAAALPNDNYVHGFLPPDAGSARPRLTMSKTTRLLGRAAGSVAKMRYSSTSNAASFRERRVFVRPVRVG